MTSQPDAGSATPDILAGSGAATPDVLTALEPKPPDPLIDITTLYSNRPQYWGIPGEQDLAFILGQQGWNVVYGPGGKEGKATFAKGIDYLGVKVDASGQVSLLLPDNKASGIPQPVRECSALTDNIRTNLAALLDNVSAMPDFPQKAAVVAKITDLITAIKSGGGHVDGVEFAISNAGGYARGPTDDLQAKFFKATGLTNADGTPLKLDFIDTVAPSELALRISEIEELGGNPRSFTSVSVTEPVVLDPAERALTGESVSGGASVAADTEGAWLAGLMIVEATIKFVFSLFPTTAERSLKDLQPEILGKLNSDPSLGGVLLIYIALVEDYSANDLTDTLAAPHPVTATFVRWEWQYGPSADDAYSWWAAPDKLLAGHRDEQPPKHDEQYFWWFDRKATTRYVPRPRK
jgi:hypothetical protein